MEGEQLTTEKEQRFSHDPPTAHPSPETNEFMLDLDSSLPRPSSPDLAVTARDFKHRARSLGYSFAASDPNLDSSMHIASPKNKASEPSFLSSEDSAHRLYSPFSSLQYFSVEGRSQIDDTAEFSPPALCGTFFPSSPDNAKKTDPLPHWDNLSSATRSTAYLPSDSNALSPRPFSSSRSLSTASLLPVGEQVPSFPPHEDYNSGSSANETFNIFDDPDPWGTLGRLLGLEQKPKATCREDYRTVDRRGVGYTETKNRGDALPQLNKFQTRLEPEMVAGSNDRAEVVTKEQVAAGCEALAESKTHLLEKDNYHGHLTAGSPVLQTQRKLLHKELSGPYQGYAECSVSSPSIHAITTGLRMQAQAEKQGELEPDWERVLLEVKEEQDPRIVTPFKNEDEEAAVLDHSNRDHKGNENDREISINCSVTATSKPPPFQRGSDPRPASIETTALAEALFVGAGHARGVASVDATMESFGVDIPGPCLFAEESENSEDE